MKLERVQMHHLRMPLVAPFETSFGREIDRECILIVAYAEGLVGLGECVASREPGYSYETIGTASHVLRDFIFPAVLGLEIRSIEAYRKLIQPIRGHNLAKAGLEMALWD